jgi:peptide methionine sulfoxide reductase MsrA
MRLRNLLVNQFKDAQIRVIVHDKPAPKNETVTMQKGRQAIRISINYNSPQIPYNDLMRCLNDSGYTHFVQSQSRDEVKGDQYNSRVVGYIKTENTQLTAFNV